MARPVDRESIAEVWDEVAILRYQQDDTPGARRALRAASILRHPPVSKHYDYTVPQTGRRHVG